jgi:hypothetical protein
MARTTRALLGLFSLVALWTDRADVRGFVQARRALWYEERTITCTPPWSAQQALAETGLTQYQ